MPSDNPFKWRQFEPGLILLCVRWYLRYAVSYRDLEEMMRERGLTPNDFDSLADLETRLLAFQRHYQSLARPFEWTFTRRDLARLLAKLALQKPDSTAA